jgi:hypothetical protein
VDEWEVYKFSSMTVAEVPPTTHPFEQDDEIKARLKGGTLSW